MKTENVNDEYAFQDGDEMSVKLLVDINDIDFVIDSPASVNIIDKMLWRTPRDQRISMGEFNTILSAYTKYRHLG